MYAPARREIEPIKVEVTSIVESPKTTKHRKKERRKNVGFHKHTRIG